MPVQAIFFDIDYTLYRYDFVPPSTILALQQLREKKILTAIATGRSINRLPQKIKELIAQQFFPLIIANNGQRIIHQGKNLFSHAIAIPDLEYLIAEFDAAGWAGLFYDDSNLISFCRKSLPNEHIYQQEQGFIVSRDYHHHNPIYQVCAFCPESEDEKLQQILKNTPFRRTRNNAHCADIFLNSCGKENAIREICHYLGINLANTVAIGDGDNDIGMFSIVGTSIAMGDANDRVKNAATFVTENIDNDGLMKGLQQLGIL